MTEGDVIYASTCYSCDGAHIHRAHIPCKVVGNKPCERCVTTSKPCSSGMYCE